MEMMETMMETTMKMRRTMEMMMERRYGLKGFLHGNF